SREDVAVAHELLAHTERQHDQSTTTRLRQDRAKHLDLHEGLAEAEACKQRTTATGNRPTGHCVLMPLEQGIEIASLQVEAVARRQLDLRLEEGAVVERRAHPAPPRAASTSS